MPSAPAEPVRVALVFGGPSREYNISCGSLKPWVTYLEASPAVDVTVVFLDRELRAFPLEERHRYTNTCEDFLPHLAGRAPLDDDALDALFAAQDLVVPLVHGAYGEDGELQRRLERVGARYLFSGPAAMAATLDKAAAHRRLAAAGLRVPRFVEVRAGDPAGRAEALAFAEDARPRVDGVRVAVKPARGGSSYGVSLVPSAAALDERVLVEAALGGAEFSVVVLEDEAGRPVALCPTEIEARRSWFDERAKYLEGDDAVFHTPFRDAELREPIRAAAAAAFAAFGLRHMARVDGFVEAGEVVVTDVNGVSGFGFSSFVFQQAALAGLSHAALLERLLRQGLAAPDRLGTLLPREDLPGRDRRVRVLFGGPTSERHVSRKSGVFTGLCLQAMGYEVDYVLADLESRYTAVGPYYALLHSVDEIHALVRSAERRADLRATATAVAAELGRGADDVAPFVAVGATTDLAGATEGADAVFLGLHGGAGEDGRVQGALEALGLPYNGPGPRSSWLCADKARAAAALAARGLAGVRATRHLVVTLRELQDVSLGGDPDAAEALWRRAREACGGAARLVVKPAADGCSTGVKLLESPEQLAAFADAVVTLRGELPFDPAWCRPGETEEAARARWRIVRLPEPAPERWLLEEALSEHGPPAPAEWTPSGVRAWIADRRHLELTCAVLTTPDGELAAATPSITIASGDALSLEEKFQQGVGTNLSLDLALDPDGVASVRRRIAAIGAALEIEGYARIDVFYDRAEDVVVLLEANTLCGLTEATVFYSQVLDWTGESPPRVLHRLLSHRL